MCHGLTVFKGSQLCQLKTALNVYQWGFIINREVCICKYSFWIRNEISFYFKCLMELKSNKTADLNHYVYWMYQQPTKGLQRIKWQNTKLGEQWGKMQLP